MTVAEPAPPSVVEADPASLAEYLLSFDWPMRNEAVHRVLVAGGMPLWRQFLAFVPNPKERGKALELGSPPFHITLLLRRLRNYDLSLTGAAADGRPEIVQELESAAFAERPQFVCQCFDLERDRFPYEDASFDLVTWCEVIEHLTENPVHALAEIHRVLKPGGALVLSTPNASRADNIANLLVGRNVWDPYHLGAPLKGSRHSREYTLPELIDLLEGCGFTIERAADVDIYPSEGRNRRALRWFLRRVAARFTKGRYGYHLFLRARKTDKPFRWYFSAGMFDSGHLAFYMSVQDPTVRVGENDAIHLPPGWSDATRGPGGRLSRRSGEVGDVYMRAPEKPRRVRAWLSGGSGEAQVMHDNKLVDLVMLGTTQFTAPDGEWTEVTIDVSDEYQPGNPVHLRLVCPGGVTFCEARVEG